MRGDTVNGQCAVMSALIHSSASLSSIGQFGQTKANCKEVNCSLSFSHSVGAHVRVNHVQLYDMGTVS